MVDLKLVPEPDCGIRLYTVIDKTYKVEVWNASSFGWCWQVSKLYDWHTVLVDNGVKKTLGDAKRAVQNVLDKELVK